MSHGGLDMMRGSMTPKPVPYWEECFGSTVSTQHEESPWAWRGCVAMAEAAEHGLLIKWFGPNPALPQSSQRSFHQSCAIQGCLCPAASPAGQGVTLLLALCAGLCFAFPSIFLQLLGHGQQIQGGENEAGAAGSMLTFNLLQK